MNRFDIWLDTAPVGSEFIYKSGTTLSKRGTGKDFSDLVYSAREAWERGEVELVQRRLLRSWPGGVGRFAWIAVKRATKATRKKWISRDGHEVTWVNRPRVAA